MFCKFLIICFSVLCYFQISQAQIPSNINFATVNVDQITDDQLLELLNKAKANNLSSESVLQMAQAKGMPVDQIVKLRQRFLTLESSSSNTTINNNSAHLTRKYIEPTSVVVNPDDSIKGAIRKKIYGSELFSSSNLIFEPNLNIATPGNYVVGPGDQLIIDVFGYSEKTDQLTVTPEGYVRIPNVGPVLVSGLTIDETRDRITNKLSTIYSGLKNGTTKVQVLLGNIRSIRVMLIGEIMHPASYTLPSLATVANALYLSGGPNENGSFRNIQVVRNGKSVAIFDLYDFLQHGNLTQNILLHDQDIIKVFPYKTRIELEGEIKHPAIFEVKQGETLQDMIDFAGGYTDKAYKGIVQAVRINNKERELITVPEDSVSGFALHSGDQFYVDSVLGRFTNRVTIAGAIFHPGSYALAPNMTVKDLIKQSDGLREDAFMNRGLIKRLKNDLSPELINFSVKEVLGGTSLMVLQREDSVIIYSRFKIREPYYVIVRGEVNHPDTIPYSDSMHLEDLILLAGGLRDAASLKQIEVARRIRSQEYSPDNSLMAVISEFEVQRDLADNPQVASFTLQPFDQVTVRRSPGYKEQVIVKVDGEVVYPGFYVLDSKTERMTDLIKKAGGLKPEAFAEGAMMLRRNKRDVSENYFERNKIDVFKSMSRNDSSSSANVKSALDLDMQLVGINLDKALREPSSKYNLLLQDSDLIRIPKKLETVTLFGEIYYPKQVRFDKTYSFRDYVRQSGGFTPNSIRRRGYVVYPNGEVASTKKILFFNSYPTVKPGSDIFIPAKGQKNGVSTQQVLGLTGGMAALMGIILGIINVTK